jgi:hypothetical protein
MSKPLVIPTPTKPIFKNRTEHNAYYGDHGIRVYRSSPEDMALQLWGDKRFGTAHLNLLEATALRDKLNEILAELHGAQELLITVAP